MYPLKITVKDSVNKDLLRHIFPTKQDSVDRILEYCKQEPRILKVWVFGSAIRDDCGIGSDIDLVFLTTAGDEDEFFKIIKPVKKLIDGNYDIFDYVDINGTGIKDTIDIEGLVIWNHEEK